LFTESFLGGIPGMGVRRGYYYIGAKPAMNISEPQLFMQGHCVLDPNAARAENRIVFRAADRQGEKFAS
jgi:hypothetical protein